MQAVPEPEVPASAKAKIASLETALAAAEASIAALSSTIQQHEQAITSANQSVETLTHKHTLTETALEEAKKIIEELKVRNTHVVELEVTKEVEESAAGSS